MAQEYNPVIRIEAGDSERTVKDLKKEISTLRDELLNLEKGSDQYNDAVKKLQQDQRDLDEVMSLTKRTATALEDSYDSLVQQMSLLKKEWRATNDEARRSQLAEEIAKINGELKEMDAEIGNFQRNVGNYVSHWDGMGDAVGDFGDRMRNMQDSIEPTIQKFESVQKISAGLASGFAAVQGAAALLGVENENLEKTFVKLQAAMALAQGFAGLGDLIEGIGKAQVAFSGLNDKIKVLSKTMGKAGWIGIILAVVSAIAGLTTYLVKNRKEVTANDRAIKDLNKSMIEGVDAAADQIAELKVYEQIATDVNRTDKERNEAAAEVLRLLGETADSTNIAAVKNGEYADSIDDVTASLIAQAKAEAAMELIKEKQIETLQKQEEARQKQQKYIDKANKQETEGVTFGDRFAAWGNNMAMAQGAEGVEYMTPQQMNESQIEDLRNKAAAQDTVIQKLEDDFNAYVNAIVNSVDMTALVSSTTSGTTTPTPTAPKLPTLDDIEIEDVEFTVPMTEEQIQAEGEIYKKKKASFSAIEKTYADDSVKIEERKLERLKELHQEAVDVGDYESQLLLMADIADQEVALTEAKNQAIIESEEKRKKKQLETINQVQTAISAAANVTQSILEITQAAAEKDGKITEKEAKRIKGMQIAVATMNMLAGITAAISGCFTTKTGPWDIALAVAQAATIAATGTANIMKIKKTDLTGSVPSGAMGAVTPNSNIYGTDIPFNYVRNVTSASETDALNQDTKVYVLESDITNAVNKQKVRVEESSF